MSFVDAVASGFRNYFNFRGRASRSEFWYWILFTLLLAVVINTIESIIWPPPQVSGDWMEDFGTLAQQQTPISNLVSLVLLIPNLSVTARRFHDAGFSAKWLFLQLAPLAYGIFAGVGAVSILLNAGERPLSYEEITSLIFLILPILAMAVAVLVIFLVMALRPSRSFYDGNKYVEPTPLSSGDEGTTA
jgi:uncharacterized membrane protein YhaH (DUF805 family)